MLSLFKQSKFIQFTFVSSILVSLLVIFLFEQYEVQKKRVSIHHTVNEYVRVFTHKIIHASSAAYPIAALVQSQKGSVAGFADLSTKMLPLYPDISALQLQPNGVIKYIIPLQGNETAIGFDVRHDPDVNHDSFNPLIQPKLTLNGPYILAQGGQGFIARLPIILDSSKGKTFWGFSAILIRTSDLLSSSNLTNLSEIGLAFKLSTQQHNNRPSEEIIRSEQAVMKNPETFKINILGNSWVLHVSPVGGWRDNRLLPYEILLAFLFTLLMSFLAILKTRRDEYNHQHITLKLGESLVRLQEAQNYAHIGLWEMAFKDSSAIFSNNMFEILGVSRDTRPNLDILQRIVPSDKAFNNIKASIRDSIEHSSNHYVIYPIIRPIDGEERWIESSGKVLFDGDGHPEKLTGFIRDITAVKQADLHKNINETVLQLLVKETPLVDVLNEIIHIIEESNPAKICSILLLDETGKHLLSTAAPSLPDFYNEAINGVEIGDSVGSCGTAAFTQKRVIVEDIQTHSYWANFKDLAAKAKLGSCWSQPIVGSNATILGTFAIYHHTSSTPNSNEIQLIEFAAQIASIAIERHRTTEQLKLSSKVFTHTQEGISITNSNGIIIDVNPAFCHITGYTREEIVGQNPSIISSGRQSAAFYSEMWKELSEHGYWKGEIWNKKKNGELFAEQLSISSLYDDSNETVNYVGIFSDITLSKSHQEELNRMAHYDLLTGLPNRALFADRFQQAIAHSKRYHTQLAVCFLDLDNFKPINDSFGHSVGDGLLIEVANRITACIREEDTISRQGGDEFTLLLNDISTPEESQQTLKRIHESLAKPYEIDDQLLHITASSGATLYPQDDADIDTLLRHADQAMYQAKLSGKNRYHLFNPSEDKEAKHKQHKISEIEYALNNNEFTLYYQPKVNMLSGEVFGVEALIRWIHPQNGLIPPLDFLPLIDGTDLDVKLGNWVIEQALKQIHIWAEQGIKLEVSVNVSSYHLQSPSFYEQLEMALKAQASTPANLLQLEVLESSALGDLSTINNTIRMCQESFGITFALDDFGTGYSSLTHLRNLPVNTIKIDQAFVRDMLADPDDFSIIEGTIGLATAFNRSLIAEGVETTEHGLMLLIMGCQFAQGYGITRPMPSSELRQWLSHYKPNPIWLSYKHLQLSEEEKKASLYSLIVNDWHDQFTQLILSPETESEVWPIMDINRCHCSAWIKRAKQEASFDKHWLLRLDQEHHVYHAIANKAQVAYQHGDMEAAQMEVRKLRLAFNKVTDLLAEITG